MNIKTKRILAALIDMVGLPIIMGMTGGMVVVIANISDPLRQRLLESLNLVFSLIFWRDFVYSPGRHLFGIELVDARTKVRVCFYRGNFFLNLWKSFLRNIFLVVPFVLVIGYVVEILMVILKGTRIADKWAGVEVIERQDISRPGHR